MNVLKLLLCVVIALSLTGCGGGKDKDKDKKPADSSKVTPPKDTKDAGALKDAAAKAAADLAASAKAKYDEVVAALKDGKLDVAEAGVKALDGMKANLSKEWQDKITAIVSQLDAAKKAPALPKLPDTPKDTPKVPDLPK